MDKHKFRQMKNPDQAGLVLDHRIPHIHPQNQKIATVRGMPNINMMTNPALIAPKPKVVDTVAYSTRRPALVVKGGEKKFGNNLVLHNLNMFAKEGTIYCIVGASNTGKSTIISLITGQSKLNKGQLFVFGSKPGSPSSGIPGRRLGFMGQQLALNMELSISQLLQYFGRLYGMSQNQVKEKIEKLSELLDLQRVNLPLKELSPGLQKRASLACTLIHDPELIVIDEGTKGMDILFQKGIWMHLQKLVSNGRTSVIISTQNIEEARQAHRVGILRNGRMLVEDSPNALLQRHGTQLLAEAVAKLCIKETIKMKKEGDKKGGAEIVCLDEWASASLGIIPSGTLIEDPNATTNKTRKPMAVEGEIISSVSYKEWMEQVVHGDEDQINQKDKKNAKTVPKIKDEVLPSYPNPSRVGNRLRALFIKQCILVQRNFLSIFLFSVVLPFAIIFSFCHTIGTQLNDVSFGVVNMNGDNSTNEFSKTCMFQDGCTNKMLDCRLLNKISGDGYLDFVDFESENEAIEEMNKGNIFGYILFKNGFSKAAYENVVRDERTTDRFSAIYDKSNIIIYNFLRDKIESGIAMFVKELKNDCENKDMENDFNVPEIEPKSDEDVANLNFTSEALISEDENGTLKYFQIKESSYQDFYIPGVTILIAFFIPLFTSSSTYVEERRRGIISRAFVSGSNSAEFLFVHVFCQLPLLAAQTAILFLVPLFIFSIEIRGWWVWQCLIIALTGFSGLSLSFLIGEVLQRMKFLYGIGILGLIFAFLSSGIIWPLYSQHWILQWVTFYLPWTLPAQTLRLLIVQGLSIMETNVWMGFAVMGAWTGFYWIFLIIVLIVKCLRV